MVDRIAAITLRLDALKDEEEEIRNDIIWEASNKRAIDELEQELKEVEHTIKILQKQLKQYNEEKERA